MDESISYHGFVNWIKNSVESEQLFILTHLSSQQIWVYTVT